MAEPQAPEHETPEDEDSRRVPMAALGVWAMIVTGLLLAIAFVDLATVSYRYNTFTQRTSRLVDERGLVDIWNEQLGDLPGGALLEAVMIASLLLILAGAAWGAWMLLVGAHAPGAMPQRRRREDR